MINYNRLKCVNEPYRNTCLLIPIHHTVNSGTKLCQIRFSLYYSKRKDEKNQYLYIGIYYEGDGKY